jgi:hypothetical protein
VGPHHLRDRQTGPCFPLFVVRCRAHGQAFTLYPEGHVPYGRITVAPVSAGGTLLHRADAPIARGGLSGPLAWESTVFAAAIDAAAGRFWASDSPADDPKRRRTQGRWIERSARLLAVVGDDLCDVPDALRHPIAERLGVPALALVNASAAWRASPGWRGRGAAVAGLLPQLAARRSLPGRILVCGHLAGLWGEPLRWDPGRGVTGGLAAAF